MSVNKEEFIYETLPNDLESIYGKIIFEVNIEKEKLEKNELLLKEKVEEILNTNLKQISTIKK